MPITSKFDFSQVGDPKGVHQGYHEMTYTKFGRGRSFCKNEVGGGGGGGGRGVHRILNRCGAAITSNTISEQMHCAL